MTISGRALRSAVSKAIGSRMSPMTVMSPDREVPEKVEDRLIVALDVPSVGSARTLIDKLDGLVSFF